MAIVSTFQSAVKKNLSKGDIWAFSTFRLKKTATVFYGLCNYKRRLTSADRVYRFLFTTGGEWASELGHFETP